MGYHREYYGDKAKPEPLKAPTQQNFKSLVDKELAIFNRGIHANQSIDKHKEKSNAEF